MKWRWFPRRAQREGPLVELGWYYPQGADPAPIAYLVNPQSGDAEYVEKWIDAIRNRPHLGRAL